MASTTVDLRCPACGQDVRAVLGPGPSSPTEWFPCPRCHAPIPVVRPRDPPPLYSWEVLPGLYPALPRPRAPKWRARRVATVGLLGVVVLALAFAGVFGYYGYAATGPGSYAVTGDVLYEIGGGLADPAVGATVTLTEDSGGTVSTSTGPGGTFAFAGVPAGGMGLVVTYAGYAPANLSTFASPVYDAGTTGLTIVLAPNGTGNSTSGTLTPFPDLESFLASIGSGIALLGIVAVIALAAAVLTRRADRPALGIVGGGAGLAAPFALYLLGLGIAFPIVITASTLLAAFGGFTLAVRAVELGQAAPAPGRYEP